MDDILYVNTYHPDYAGFILSEGFKRTVDIDTFYDLELLLNKEIKRVGVFVNEPIENILESFAQKLDVIQLHGEYAPVKSGDKIGLALFYYNDVEIARTDITAVEDAMLAEPEKPDIFHYYLDKLKKLFA